MMEAILSLLESMKLMSSSLRSGETRVVSTRLTFRPSKRTPTVEGAGAAGAGPEGRAATTPLFSSSSSAEMADCMSCTEKACHLSLSFSLPISIHGVAYLGKPPLYLFSLCAASIVSKLLDAAISTWRRRRRLLPSTL